MVMAERMREEVVAAAQAATPESVADHMDALVHMLACAQVCVEILSTPWIRCPANGGTCACGCLFCPFCECHMNNIDPGDDGHSEGCIWARAAIACGLG